MQNSFDRVDSIIPVPASSSKEKVVCLGAKLLETKKENRKVLPEEKYVDNLEKLIVRDYFPELPKLKAQSEYLEALAKNDHLKIRELQIRYSTRRTDRRTSPSARPTPSVFDPESPGPSNVEESPYANKEGDNEALVKKKKKTPLDKLTVQSYLDKYTSEDNASFEELAALHNKRNHVKNAWMYDAEKKHNEAIDRESLLAITAPDEQLVALRNGESGNLNKIDGWAKQNEKVINKEATRFKAEFSQQPHQTVMARAAFQQAANYSGHVDITGKELGKVDASTLGLVATPAPAPGVDESPLMTWGEIEGTPFRLDAPDISDAVEDGPKRKHAIDQIQKMAPKTPTFNSSRSTGKFSTMSPAARKFASATLGIRLGTDKLRYGSPSSKTPSSSRSGALYSPAFYSKLVKVKKEVPSSPSQQSKSTPIASVTDNLLNLPPSSPLPVETDAIGQAAGSLWPSRPSASDFF
uniref:Uncharacterized protein n=1 Tax=Ditylenchus dipsaci TaxID=166011 RepID=A0A915E6F6_9BILA